jgi:EAL domain-containing protein (putative c-di-GMP-specific phosphodiesterase class I)
MIPVRVLVADDEAEVRSALVDLLTTDPPLTVVGAAADTDEAISLCTFHGPDVVIMDVKMPGGGGPQATRTIRRQRPGTHVIALSAYEDRSTVLAMLAAGAAGYVTKGSPAAEIISAIHRAVQGLAVLSPAASAEVVNELATRLRADEDVATLRRERAERIQQAMSGHLRMVFQPIVDLRNGQTVGVEALARFGEDAARTADLWFADAAELGMRAALEATAFSTATAQLDALPDSLFMSVNISPETAVQGDFLSGMSEAALPRLVVELTEHAPVHDYDELRTALAPLRTRGGLVAVDDAGAGFASLRHILLLNADFIKIDASLTQDLDSDRSKRALASALISFATEIGALVIAEGIEHQRDLDTLKELGVTHGQGYLLGRPAPLDELMLAPEAAAPLG